ncbi:hypothetical protein ACSAZK_02745 [Methanosarcina sp. Mfa9]|uniref:hypothetical protein n=1 Tax=Methanosarcina sp. Mfa9 TaxID=3439063 RepID=UPI003F8762BE
MKKKRKKRNLHIHIFYINTVLGKRVFENVTNMGSITRAYPDHTVFERRDSVLCFGERHAPAVFIEFPEGKSGAFNEGIYFLILLTAITYKNIICVGDSRIKLLYPEMILQIQNHLKVQYTIQQKATQKFLR